MFVSLAPANGVAAFVVASLAPAIAVLCSSCSLNTSRLARRRSNPRPSRSRRVSSRLSTRPSSVDVARALAPLLSARASCIPIAALVIVSITPVSDGAALAHVLSMHGVSRAVAPALGRLARAASRRGSPLGRLRSTSRARSLRLFHLDVVSRSRGVRGRFCRTPQWRCCLRVCSRCTARRAPALRPSAVSLALRFVAAPHSAVFGRPLARIAPLLPALASCLTIAAFVVVSLAPANDDAALAYVLSKPYALRAISPALGRLARVASRRGSVLYRLQLTPRARSLHCLRLGRRVLQPRRSWSSLSHPPSAVLLLPVCSQYTAPRAPSLRPSAVSLVSRLVAAPHSSIFGRRRARARSAAFGSGGMSPTNDLKRRRSRLQRSWSSFAHRAPSVFAIRTPFRRQCSRSRIAGALVLARVACTAARFRFARRVPPRRQQLTLTILVMLTLLLPSHGKLRRRPSPRNHGRPAGVALSSSHLLSLLLASSEKRWASD